MTITQQLTQQYPHFKNHIRKIRGVLGSMKYRCGKHKSYLNVKCEFFSIWQFMEFLEIERQRGRDYTKIENPQIARIFDDGNYTANNCRVLSKSENIKESHNKPIIIFDSLNGKTSIFRHGVINFYKINKEVLGFSLNTLYRKIRANKPIPIGDKGHFIKVSFL